MKDKYLIKVEGKLIEVSEEIYYTYYKMERHERWLAEKDANHGVISLSMFDTDGQIGEELIADKNMIISELVETKIMIEELQKYLLQLNEKEQRLINCLFFKNMSIRETAILFECSSTTLHERKIKVLNKLKSMFNKKN